MDIKGKLQAANERLKRNKMGVQIEARSDRLNLRATLPPKPGSDKTRPHQQRISLQVHANPTGLAYAEKEAQRVGYLLDSKEFDWDEYFTPTKPIPLPIETIADRIAGFE